MTDNEQPIAEPGGSTVVRRGVIFTGLFFLIGWAILALTAPGESTAVGYAAMWGSFLVTIIVAIHGGWRAVPRLVLGFGIGELLVWGAFFYLEPYDPTAEDVTFLAAFGCAFGALVASRFLLLRIERRCPHCGVSHRLAVLVPLWSGCAAAAILGGLAYLFAQFSVHYVADPANAAVAVVLVSLMCALLGGGYGPRLARWPV